MNKTRIEAFSDAVIAIILTIMVLELKIPHGDSLDQLTQLAPQFLSYILSFVYLGIYWNNHHHLFYAVKKVNGRILWANMHLLFWLSLLPFATGWMGENHYTAVPTAIYGLILLMASIGYWVLVQVLLKNEGKNSMISNAIGNDIKGKISILLYVVALPLSFITQWAAQLIYLLVAILWLVPDKRIENLV